MKFAVLKTGGKQYLVKEGDTLMVEKVDALKEGDSITLDEVLLTDSGNATEVGAPFVGSSVGATFHGNAFDEKISVIKYKAKSRYFKKRGHKQPRSKIKITSIK